MAVQAAAVVRGAAKTFDGEFESLGNDLDPKEDDHNGEDDQDDDE